MSSSNKRNATNILVQGSILAIASFISRIIGLVYRIPLNGIIGKKGNDYYGTAFEIYSILLIMSAYSLPLAVSKLVSARVAMGQRKNAYRIFKGALMLALISGGIATLIVYFGASIFTQMLRTPLAVFALKVLAPTILVAAVLGVVRGFFQGLGTMMPSAVSQIVEQIVNAIVSVGAAFILFGYGSRIGAVLGNEDDYGSAYGAAGGTLGTNLGAVFGLLFVGFLFFAYKPMFKRQMRRDRSNQTESYADIFKILLLTIVPVLLSTTIYNISGIIDQAIFKNVANLQGYSSDNISEWWGIFCVQYKTIINIPLAIASAMAASCVPNLSAAYSCRDRDGVRRQINTAIRFIMVISIPCAVGLGVLASPVMLLLFHETSPVAGGLIRAGAISVVFYSMSTLSNGLLQGIDRMREPVKNALIALVLHIAFLFFLMFGLHLNIYAVVYANAFFAFVMCVLNAMSVKRYSGYRQEVVKTFLVPAASSAIMGVLVYLVYELIHNFTHNNPIATIVAIIIGGISYFVCLLLLKGLSEEEMLRLPKGRTILSIARKMKLMK